MKQKSVLSICIPTVNRGNFIGQTLDSIISQITPGVEIVIVDGASTDNTEAVVRRYQEASQYIRYVRLPERGGFDKDLCRVVEDAEGEYCWLFSDDDVMKPGAVARVMGEIASGYDVVIVNAEIRDVGLERVLKSSFLKIRKDTVYSVNDFEKFFVDSGDLLSFFGSLVVRRSVWEARKKSDYFGSMFVHVGILFQKPFTAEALVIAEPLISIRYGNALWSAKSFVVSLISWPELIWSFAHFSSAAKAAICDPEPWRSLKKLLIYRARGAYGISEYEVYLKKRLDSISHRYLSWLVAKIPGALINLLMYLFFKSLGRVHKHSEFHLLDLQNSPYFYRRYKLFGVEK